MARKTKLPEGWKEVMLGDLCQIKKGSSITKDQIAKGDIPVIAGGQQPAYYHNISNRSGEVVTVSGTGAYAGFVAYFNTPIFASDCSTLQTTSKDISIKYIYYFLKGRQDKIYDLQKGIAQPHVYPKDLAKIKTPLPPSLNAQEKIVAILEKADQVKEWRTEADELTKNFLKSLFTKMFGNPIKNERGWKVVTVSDISERIQIGPFGTQLHVQDYIDNGIPLINPTHIIDNKIFPEASFTVSKNKFDELANYHLKTGDIVMARRGEMARCAVVTSKEDRWLCGTGSLYIRSRKCIDSTFLLFCLIHESTKETLENESRGVTMNNLNLTIVNNLRLILPPLPLQLKFASIVKEVEAMKEQQKQSKEQIDNLFNALLQKAFTGELVA